MPPQPLTDLRSDSAEGSLRALQQSYERAPGEQLTVDVSALAHLERPAGALLSNLLIGTLGDAAVEVVLPAGEPLDWLVASGLAFAVANRLGSTRLHGSIDLQSEEWRGAWSTGVAASWRNLTGPVEPALFEPDVVGETTLKPDLFGPRYAAFVDAHLSPAESAPSHPLTELIWPWLDRLLPGRRRRPANRTRVAFIAELGRVVAETVGNVREHATGGDRPLHSLVQLAVTRGGRASHDRLHLIVQDNGPGIAATARPKVAPTLTRSLSDHQLLFKLCDGSLPPWGRARGMGLPTVLQTCRRLDGSLRIWTKNTRVQAESNDSPLTAGDGLVRVDGTVLSMTLPLPD
jgi:hypothetical protein